jgi:phosphoribosylaminoimidazole-succinocarboxamide synthase
MSYPPPPPSQIDVTTLGEPVYHGSVQHLYAIPSHPAYLACQTTEAGSVFDVGSIFHIEGNDLSRALFRHAMYTRLALPSTWQQVRQVIEADPNLPANWRQDLLTGPLESMCEHGAHTHHVGMIDATSGAVVSGQMPANPSTFNVVRRYPVMTPPQRPLLGTHVFDYAQFHQSHTYVIPLEYIVRFGITSGSSILRKYQAMSEAARRTYEQELGISSTMQPWSLLSPPIFDLTSKYEPEDRNVSKQEALLMSGLSGQDFLNSIKMALLGGYAVRAVLEEIGLLLWDLKWEFAVDRESLLFVDTIDNDSFRATRFLEVEGKRVVIHYNKQAMRDYYRILHADWYAGVNSAKAKAKTTGQAFKEILKQGQAEGNYPPTPAVEPEFLALQGRKSELIRQHLIQAASASEISSQLEACGQAEIAFYRQRDRLDALLKVNAVDTV